MESIKEMMKGMTKEAKIYWLGIAVKYGQITKVQAGILTISEGLSI